MKSSVKYKDSIYTRREVSQIDGMFMGIVTNSMKYSLCEYHTNNANSSFIQGNGPPLGTTLDGCYSLAASDPPNAQGQ